MVIERRAAQISGHSSEIEAPASPIEGRALFIGKPSFSIKGATPGLEERALYLERASLRIERSSSRPIPPSLLIRSRACHPERSARNARVAKVLLIMCHLESPRRTIAVRLYVPWAR